VVAELARAFPVTLTITVVSMILSMMIGVTAGIWSATRVNSWIDNSLRVVLLTSTSIPTFFLGLVLIYVFSVELHWFPSFGWGGWNFVILPSVALAAFPLALIARLTRASMIEVLGMRYVTTARAKGLPEASVIIRHAFRNALVPVATIIGLQFGTLLTGAVLTETVFSLPGIGQLLIGAIFARDYAIIRGCVLLAAVTFALINLAVDLLYLMLDPRIRYA
jgi:ABC-type dipeptide/oligopeptide/nickel transport system permease component